MRLSYGYGQDMLNSDLVGFLSLLKKIKKKLTGTEFLLLFGVAGYGIATLSMF